MICPQCQQPLKKIRWDISKSPEADNKEYDRTVYHCEADDVWVSTEVPIL